MSYPLPESALLTLAEISRRKWLRAIIGAIVGSISSVIAAVVVGAVLSPAFATRRETWVPARPLNGLPTRVDDARAFVQV